MPLNEGRRMQTPDLRAGAPRRWATSIEGIRWLPRLIDKARAAHDGTLGAYLFGQSPIDRALLRELHIGHTEFARIVLEAGGDDARVVAALRERDPHAIQRARAWSDNLPRRHGAFLFIIDIDDGYAGRAWSILKPISNAASNTLTWAVKRAWPSRAIERAKERL